MAKHIGGPARAQQVTVVDAVRAQRHRRDQRHHLRALVARADTLAEHNAPIDQRLDPQSLGERRGYDDPGVRDRPLIVKDDRDAIQSDRPVTMHHEGDLLLQAATAESVAFHLLRRSFFAQDRTEPPSAAVDRG
jgi:hypothetical protein